MMKKIFVLLALALVLFSCDNDIVEETNPFVGTWENDNGYRIVFTATNVTSYKPDGNIYWTGIYTYDDAHITVKLDVILSDSEMTNAYGNTFAPWYRFEDGVFILNTSEYTRVV